MEGDSFGRWVHFEGNWWKCSADFNLPQEIDYKLKMLERSLNSNNNLEEEAPTRQLDHGVPPKNL